MRNVQRGYCKTNTCKWQYPLDVGILEGNILDLSYVYFRDIKKRTFFGIGESLENFLSLSVGSDFSFITFLHSYGILYVDD